VSERERKLRICHVAPVTPGQCGLYETARELAAAEQDMGHRVYIVDPRPYEREEHKAFQTFKCSSCGEENKVEIGKNVVTARPADWSADREVCIAPISEIARSDVVISHSGMSEDEFGDFDTPRIHVAHGRPNSSYRIQRSGKGPILQTYHNMMKDARWKKMVTFWPGYGDYLSLLFPRVVEMNPFVDLNHWQRQDTGWDWDWDGKGGETNLLICDIWRMDKDPYFALHGAFQYAKEHEGTKIHLYGCDQNPLGRDTIIQCLKEHGVLGDVKAMVKDLRPAYSAADSMITPHRIATRTVREALACGCNVVAANGNPYTDYTADIEDLREYAEVVRCSVAAWKQNPQGQQLQNRTMAEAEFDVRQTAKAFVNLIREVVAA